MATTGKSSSSISPTYLSRKFVARRISEGETGRLKEELKCEACGKGYKHISSLAKHLWEHTPEWNMTSKLLISKHQQVQLLEAASILISMNESEHKQHIPHIPSTSPPPSSSSSSPSHGCKIFTSPCVSESLSPSHLDPVPYNSPAISPESIHRASHPFCHSTIGPHNRSMSKVQVPLHFVVPTTTSASVAGSPPVIKQHKVSRARRSNNSTDNAPSEPASLADHTDNSWSLDDDSVFQME